MEKNLVIVESPAKARTINRILGEGYEVKASMGHVRDLPKNALGVDVEHGFAPTYVTLKDKQKVISELRKAAKAATAVFLAADPDREGESICYHLQELLSKEASSFFRVVMNEITTPAVKRAFENPGSLDINKVEAQQARRILDRLVGYQISPLLWRKVKTGLSAGRVQSVALRLIVEREREIQAFQSVEYWTIDADLLGRQEPSFTARVIERDRVKLELSDEGGATAAVAELEQQEFVVDKITVKPRKRNPAQPFITSTLQQEAFRRLGFSVARTMRAAQRLYEGIQLSGEGSVGLITYMRTDSTRVAGEAVQAARSVIGARFGSDYLPPAPPKPKKVKAAQEAHEAIRPTYVERTPESLEGVLEPELLKLYRLIWNRFVSSQMKAASFEATIVDVSAGRYRLRATGSRLLFDGFLAVYGRGNGDEEDKLLPSLREGEELKLLGLRPEQNFTQPPPRYSEASLVRELEERGIGRPSTYAAIISTIQSRDYVRRDKGRLLPTDLGLVVTELLEDNFSDLMDYEYTARMERVLDRIEDGQENWIRALENFNTEFDVALKTAAERMRNVKREVEQTDIECDKCGAAMVKRWGRYGRFLACSRYPECKNAKPLPDPAAQQKNEKLQGMAERIGPQVSDICGTPLALRSGRYGFFLGCSRYPKCKYTVPVKKDGTINWEKAKRDLCAEKGGAPEAQPKKRSKTTATRGKKTSKRTAARKAKK
jgi:DNA topoisomerase-1